MASIKIDIEKVGPDRWVGEVIGPRGGRHLANREASATLDDVLAWVRTAVGEVDTPPASQPDQQPASRKRAGAR